MHFPKASWTKFHTQEHPSNSPRKLSRAHTPHNDYLTERPTGKLTRHFHVGLGGRVAVGAVGGKVEHLLGQPLLRQRRRRTVLRRADRRWLRGPRRWLSSLLGLRRALLRPGKKELLQRDPLFSPIKTCSWERRSVRYIKEGRVWRSRNARGANLKGTLR